MQKNRDFVISTDTCSDLPFAYYDDNQINVLSLSYTMDGETYFANDRTIDQHAFYDKMRGGLLPITAQINPEQAVQGFEALTSQGKDVLHLAFSSGLSGTCASTVVGAQEVMERCPGAKILVIDTLAASLGQGLLVHFAVEQKKQGKTIDEIAAWIETAKHQLVHYFTVEDLNHLYRGGRVSKAAAVFGTMLGIKPVLYVNETGHLIPMGKVRGRKQSMLDLIARMKPKMEGIQNKTVFISHGDCLEDARFCADEIKKKYQIKQFVFNYVGPVIGTHSGPGTIAIFFLGKNKQEDGKA